MAKKAARTILHAVGRGHGHARGHGRGIGQGRVQGRGRRGGASSRSPMPFPMELSSQSSSNNTENDQNLTRSLHSNPSEHPSSSDLSNDEVHASDIHDGDSPDLTQDNQLKSQPIIAIPRNSRLCEGSNGEGESSWPCHSVCIPARFMQGKFQ